MCTFPSLVSGKMAIFDKTEFAAVAVMGVVVERRVHRRQCVAVCVAACFAECVAEFAAVCCSVLLSVAICCSALQCVAVCCSVAVSKSGSRGGTCKWKKRGGTPCCIDASIYDT